MNPKTKYDLNKSRIEDIECEIKELKQQREKLRKENFWLLVENCTFINKKENRCDYDNTPLNRDGHFCSDCVSGGYSHIKIKE